jgi:DNA (cytosine-5)-methyltransferase 1
VYRHRYFESSHLLFASAPCHHPTALMDGYVSVYGGVVRGRQTGNTGNRYRRYPLAYGREAMGIDWMTQDELSQAIPPAYTHWIGAQLMTVITTQEKIA